MKQKGPYIKHVYWLTPDEHEDLRDELSIEGIRLKTAKGIVCAPLDRINRITAVPPGVWDETCKRQGSWYRTSDRKGQYLIVSSFELEGLENAKTATITESDFIPPRLAIDEDKEALLRDPALKRRLPEDWLRPGETEKRIYLRWAARLGSDVKDYGFLYLSHTANHANFINPAFYVEEGEEIIPYSIDRSAHLCSCCVELFQILGGEFKKKLVAPCPGATIFARLRPDRFLLVEKA